jgi:hypothetical protein
MQNKRCYLLPFSVVSVSSVANRIFANKDIGHRGHRDHGGMTDKRIHFLFFPLRTSAASAVNHFGQSQKQNGHGPFPIRARWFSFKLAHLRERVVYVALFGAAGVVTSGLASSSTGPSKLSVGREGFCSGSVGRSLPRGWAGVG